MIRIFYLGSMIYDLWQLAMNFFIIKMDRLYILILLQLYRRIRVYWPLFKLYNRVIVQVYRMNCGEAKLHFHPLRIVLVGVGKKGSSVPWLETMETGELTSVSKRFLDFRCVNIVLGIVNTDCVSLRSKIASLVHADIYLLREIQSPFQQFSNIIQQQSFGNGESVTIYGL